MKKLFPVILFLIFSNSFYSQISFPQNPNWISADVSGVSTGGAFADIDYHGHLDVGDVNGDGLTSGIYFYQ